MQVETYKTKNTLYFDDENSKDGVLDDKRQLLLGGKHSYASDF